MIATKIVDRIATATAGAPGATVLITVALVATTALAAHRYAQHRYAQGYIDCAKHCCR